MKLLPFALVLGSGMAIGSLATLALRSPAANSSTSHTVVPERATAPRSGHRTPSNKAAQEELHRLLATKARPEKSGFENQGIPELEALVKAILEEGDPITGVEGPKREMLEQIILAMARKDRDGTLAWVDENLPTQRFMFYRSILQDVMKGSSTTERLDFLISKNFEPKDIGKYAGTLLLEGKEALGTEAALHLLKYCNAIDGSFSGGGCRFAPDFDFARFATETARRTRADGNKGPDVFPTNFFQEWVKVSPQEAVDFYYANCMGENRISLPYNDFDKIISGVKTNVSTEAYASWFGQTLSQQTELKNTDRSIINQMIEQELSNPGLLGSAIDSIQNPETRAQLLEGILSSSTESSSSVDGGIRLRNTLALYSDPAERLAQVEHKADELRQRHGDRDVDAMINSLCTQLANLGHSAEDIQRVRVAGMR